MFLSILMINVRNDKAMDIRMPGHSGTGHEILDRVHLLHTQDLDYAGNQATLYSELFAVRRRTFQTSTNHVKSSLSQQIIIQIKNTAVYLVFYRDFPLIIPCKKGTLLMLFKLYAQNTNTQHQQDADKFSKFFR